MLGQAITPRAGARSTEEEDSRFSPGGQVRLQGPVLPDTRLRKDGQPDASVSIPRVAPSRAVMAGRSLTRMEQHRIQEVRIRNCWGSGPSPLLYLEGVKFPQTKGSPRVDVDVFARDSQSWGFLLFGFAACHAVAAGRAWLRPSRVIIACAAWLSRLAVFSAW